MIVAVVIGALYKLRGDTNHLFTQVEKKQQQSYLSTFLLWNRGYGLESVTTSLYSLVDTFDIDDDLRRELKSKKVKIAYKKIERIELSDVRLELGITKLAGEDYTLELKRIISQ